MATKKVITSIDSRLGKRGKREVFSFSGVEAQNRIDEYMNELRMTKEDLDSYEASAAASRDSASESAREAATSGEHAAASAAESAQSALLSESWAVGGTGERDGEDESNSRYYAEQSGAFASAADTAAENAAESMTAAAASASQAETSRNEAEGYAETAKDAADRAESAVTGVTAWNGRTGKVTPEAGDYTAAQVTTASGSDVETELGSKASQTDLSNLQTTINETVTKNIEELQTNLDAVSGDVETLQTNLNSVSCNVETIEADITTLVGTDSSKSVRTIANEELTEQLIPENAKESLDTLKEIAAWIQSHPDDAAAMNEELAALKQRVTNIHSYKEVTISASGWSTSKDSSLYYTYTIDGLTIYDENPEIFLKGGDSAAWSQQSAYMSIDKGETGDGSIILYTSQTGLKDFTILIKGVA